MTAAATSNPAPRVASLAVSDVEPGAADETDPAVEIDDDVERDDLAEREVDVSPLTVRAVFDGAAWVSWRFIVILVALGLVLYGLIQLRVVVLPVIVTAFVGTLLGPLADRLKGRGLRPAQAAMLALLAGLLALGGAATFIGVQIYNESDSLADRFGEAIDEIEDWLIDGPLEVDRDAVEDARESLSRAIEDNSDALTQGAVRVGSVALEVVAGAVLTVILLFFMLKDGDRAGALVADTLSQRWSDDLRSLGVKVWRTMAGYLRGVGITGLVDGLVIGIGLALLGVPLAAPLAVLTFLGAFIPLVGATLAGVLAVLVALVGNGFGTALAVAGLVIAVQQIESNVLAPIVLSRAVQLHAVTILLALTAGGILAGIVGAFLAVPIAAVGKTVIEHYRHDREDPATTPG